MFLAEAAAQGSGLPDPNHYSTVGWIVLTLAGLLGIVKLALDLYKDHFKEDPIPSKTYVTKEHFDAEIKEISDEIEKNRVENKAEHEGIFSKIGGHERGIQADIRAIESSVSRLEERTATTNSSLSLLGEKVDRIVERIKA